MLITIIYDSYAYNPAARVSSGFGCIVQTAGRTLLFDTGIHGPTLLYNMKQLGFNPLEVDDVIISHIDPDHVGGLFNFLEENRNVRVFIPRSLPEPFKDLIALHGAKIVEVCRRKEIYPFIETTGEMGRWIKEQAMMMRTEKGVILIVGDSHAGILNVIKKVKRQTREKIALIIGGFSLSGTSQSDLESVVKSFRRMGVKKVAPCHSSGDRTREIFQQEYKENYIECGVGWMMEVQ